MRTSKNYQAPSITVISFEGSDIMTGSQGQTGLNPFESGMGSSKNEFDYGMHLGD